MEPIVGVGGHVFDDAIEFLPDLTPWLHVS
jgi:hypothetical protein